MALQTLQKHLFNSANALQFTDRSSLLGYLTILRKISCNFVTVKTFILSLYFQMSYCSSQLSLEAEFQEKQWTNDQRKVVLRLLELLLGRQHWEVVGEGGLHLELVLKAPL